MNEQITVLDAMPTAKLMNDLGAKRTSFYKAIAALGISTFMDGKTSMIRSEDAERLKDHYQNKIVEINGEPVKTISLSELENRQTDKRTNEIIPLLQAFSACLPQAEPDPFRGLRLLEEACDRGWLLPSKQVAELIGRSGSKIAGSRFSYCGFRFVAVREGRRNVWKITKPKETDE